MKTNLHPPMQELAAPASPLSTAPPPAATAEEASRVVRFKQTQLDALNRQATRARIPLVLAAACIGFVVYETVPLAQILVWMGAIAAVNFARWYYSVRWAPASRGNVDTQLRTLIVLSLCGGAVAGIGPLLFLTRLQPAEQAILTMLMVSWASAAVSVNAAYRATYFAYVLPMLGPLVVLWGLGGSLEHVSVAVLIVLFVVLQAGFVRDNERIFRESFDIRYENERLIRELEVQRQAVIRERDRAEEANRAKSRFLAAASHDLRQPLHAVSLYSAALSVRQTDERTRELSGRIGTGIASLSSLLDGLLDISKLDAEAVHPEPTVFSIDSLVSRLASDFRPIALSKGLALDVQSVEGVFVRTDAMLLERVVRNLLDNAVKYTSLGGVTLRADVVGRRVEISVTDTGDGIPEHEQQRIFEEFYQVSNPERDRSRGLGLGLAIVQRLTRLLGLELRLRSRLGEGSVFTLSLPRARPEVHQPDASAPDLEDAPASLPDGLRVLIVDDEAAIRHGMQTLLESWGCSVVAAGDVQTALRELDRGAVDILVADLRLRGSETGATLAGTARDRYGIPVLLVTGDTGRDRLREATALGVTLLHKPVSERELRRHIARACRNTEALPADASDGELNSADAARSSETPPRRAR